MSTMVVIEVQQVSAGQRIRFLDGEEVYEVARVSMRKGRCVMTARTRRQPFALMLFDIGTEVEVL